MRTCPTCSLLSPDSAIVCDCGCILDGAAAKSFSAAALRPPDPKPNRLVLGRGAKIVTGASGFFLGLIAEGIVEAVLGIKSLVGASLPAGIAGAVLMLHVIQEPITPRSRNYLVRHWHGDLPLGVSYWVGGWLVGVVGAISIALSGGWVGGLGPPPLPVLVVAWAVAAVAAIWYFVGTWRSSDRRTARGETSIWSGAAKLGLVIGAVAFVAAFTAGGLPMLRAAFGGTAGR
jgi:hypothetical protein